MRLSLVSLTVFALLAAVGCSEKKGGIAEMTAGEREMYETAVGSWASKDKNVKFKAEFKGAGTFTLTYGPNSENLSGTWRVKADPMRIVLQPEAGKTAPEFEIQPQQEDGLLRLKQLPSGPMYTLGSTR